MALPLTLSPNLLELILLIVSVDKGKTIIPWCKETLGYCPLQNKAMVFQTKADQLKFIEHFLHFKIMK